MITINKPLFEEHTNMLLDILNSSNIELKEKEYQHEIEMQKLRSETAIKEKNEELYGNALSSVLGNVFQDVLSGKISAQDLEKISKQFPNTKK